MNSASKGAFLEGTNIVNSAYAPSRSSIQRPASSSPAGLLCRPSSAKSRSSSRTGPAASAGKAERHAPGRQGSAAAIVVGNSLSASMTPSWSSARNPISTPAAGGEKSRSASDKPADRGPPDGASKLRAAGDVLSCGEGAVLPPLLGELAEGRWPSQGALHHVPAHRRGPVRLPKPPRALAHLHQRL